MLKTQTLVLPEQGLDALSGGSVSEPEGGGIGTEKEALEGGVGRSAKRKHLQRGPQLYAKKKTETLQENAKGITATSPELCRPSTCDKHEGAKLLLND